MTDANSLAQDQGQNIKIDGDKYVPEHYIKLNRQAAAEGIVMLRNNATLPLSGQKISVFGRVQLDYFYVGNGSGGLVRPPYTVNLIQGIENNSGLDYNLELAEIYAAWSKANPAITDAEWGKWPTNHPEMPLTLDVVQKAKTVSDVAVVVIGRCAGEDRDSTLTEGSFYLTKEEENMLDLVTGTFEKIVLVINSGNIIDFSWYKKYERKIGALLYVWQGGMESGNAICDILSGDISPSGKLPTVIARRYEDYPSYGNFGGKEFNNYVEDIFVGYRYFETFAKDKVLFPFGFGLSYTSFDIVLEGEVTVDSENITVLAKVTNTGTTPGAEVVQVYYSAPQGLLGKPALELGAFGKTKVLNPGEEAILVLRLPLYYMASYDDAGKTGHKSAYVLEAGEYGLFVGKNARETKKAGAVKIDQLTVLAQHNEAAAAEANFKRMVAQEGAIAYEEVPTRTTSLKERILANMPKDISMSGVKHSFQDVIDDKISLETFVAGLDIIELEALTRGDLIMDSPHGPSGNTGTFGGLTESLRAKGVIPIVTTDGPAGIRLNTYCVLIPCGLTLSSTWNTPLVKELAAAQGQELTEKGSHVLLAPGMNILRDPLCGRNFEYFSEDPLLSGKMASAMVKGLQKHGKSACPKHFACNNQEEVRNVNDSRVSERALREIYLRGFEICVKEAKPNNLMTSYNLINGVWGHYHYDLCTTILRGEWGYEGNIMTDWWMKPCEDPDFPGNYNDGYRVRAQVDVLMPGAKIHHGTEGDGSLLDCYEKKHVTLGEIQRCAINTLKFVMHVMK